MLSYFVIQVGFFYNFGNFKGYFGFSGDVQYQRRERTTEGGREDHLTRKDMSNQHNFRA
jgi:hypothetical protein